MNTPAHAIAGLLVLGRRDRPELDLPILLGSVAPDVPMVWFYFWQKVVRGVPERTIWSESYFEADWQAFFDVFNSLPVLLGCAVVAWRFGRPRLTAFLAAMAVHVVGDLPLHHDDGHRHFYPLSDWRFESPVSYWDPAHYGGIVAPLEAVLVVAGCFVLARRRTSLGARLAIAAVAVVYALYWGYAVFMWM